MKVEVGTGVGEPAYRNSGRKQETGELAEDQRMLRSLKILK